MTSDSFSLVIKVALIKAWLLDIFIKNFEWFIEIESGILVAFHLKNLASSSFLRVK